MQRVDCGGCMRCSALRRHVARFAIMALLALLAWAPARADDNLDAPNKEAGQLSRNGRIQDAIAVAEMALGIAERTLDASHPATLESVHNLAVLYREHGRYAEAERLFRRALAGQETSLGASHPDTLTTVNNFGLLLVAQGRYAEAEPLCRRALAGREAALGTEHPDTL